MHAFQYPSYRKKRNDVTPSLRNRWRSTDYRDLNNTAHFSARAVRHAAQINTRAHSRLRHCFLPEHAVNQPVFNAFSIMHF